MQPSGYRTSVCVCVRVYVFQIIVDDDDSKVWSLYDAGPKSIRCPIIFLPPVSGTAEVFFQQVQALTGWGYRVISLQYPVYWDLLEFCDGFRKLLDHLQLDKVHLFGASLGGFLAQKFAEYTHKSPRVHSLILCNSFSDTSIFHQTWTANSFWLMPAFLLKKIVLGNFAKGPVDPKMADAIDFMVDRLESLSQSELASRLTLNCQNSYVEPHKIKDVAVTIIDIHLRQFHGTRYAAIDPAMVSAEELEVQRSHLSYNQDSEDNQ
uniref:Maspardin n=1 Tax=Poecilia latipinna TaxID=48699 RepID=A0A3B3UXR6_9TELE